MSGEIASAQKLGSKGIGVVKQREAMTPGEAGMANYPQCKAACRNAENRSDHSRAALVIRRAEGILKSPARYGNRIKASISIASFAVIAA